MGIAVEILACAFVNVSLDILLYRSRHAFLEMIGGVYTILIHVLKQQALHFKVLFFRYFHGCVNDSPCCNWIAGRLRKRSKVPIKINAWNQVLVIRVEAALGR